MVKSKATIPFMALTLDRVSGTSLYQQLYQNLREAILRGQLAGGTRLPSTRELASLLDISRNTVMNAFDQLLAEGYLEGKVGAGTYISYVLPDQLLQTKESQEKTPPIAAESTRLIDENRHISQLGKRITDSRSQLAHLETSAVAFRPGIPALDAFPFEIWSHLVTKHWRHPALELMGYGDPAGYKPLREAIAGYLSTSRAVRCTPDQVIIIDGSQQGLDLTARLLLEPGDAAWIEDPGYLGARSAFNTAGAQIIPVPLDNEGLDIEAGLKKHPGARLVYVSPSHQYPLGITMSLSRRLALLNWASTMGRWIIEDDYDSEYRYVSRPLAALQGLDTARRVIYIGTFSKVLFPSLRLGYLVVPPDLVELFLAARAVASRHSPTIDQAILADFIFEGHFARHIRRMRALYAERQALLITTIKRELNGFLEVSPAEAGMHLVGWLPKGQDDREISFRAAKLGIVVPPISRYRLEAQIRPGLLIGYALPDSKGIEQGIKKLRQVF